MFLVLGAEVTWPRANPRRAPGKGSRVPASPTQQTLECPMEHAGRAGRMGTADSSLKAWAERRLALSEPKSPVSPRQGLLGFSYSFFLLFHKQVLKSWRSDLSFQLS